MILNDGSRRARHTWRDEDGDVMLHESKAKFEMAYRSVLELKEGELLGALQYVANHVYMLDPTDVPEVVGRLTEVASDLRKPEEANCALKLLGVLLHSEQEKLRSIAERIDFRGILECVSGDMSAEAEELVQTVLTFTDASLERSLASGVFDAMVMRRNPNWRLISAVVRRFPLAFTVSRNVAVQLMHICKHELASPRFSEVAIPVLQVLVVVLEVAQNEGIVEEVGSMLFPGLYELFEHDSRDFKVVSLSVIDQLLTVRGFSSDAVKKADIVPFLISLISCEDAELAHLIWSALSKCLCRHDLRSSITTERSLAALKDVAETGTTVSKAESVVFLSHLLALSLFDDALFDWFCNEHIVTLLFDAIGVVPNRALITVFENLEYALRDLTSDDVWKLARDALNAETSVSIIDTIQATQDDSLITMASSLLQILSQHSHPD